MSGADLPTALADPRPIDGAAPRHALIERRLAMLTRLAEIGMEIAEAAGRRAAALAEGGDGRADAADPALSFSRAARAVRLTIALQSRLAHDLAGLGEAQARARAAEAARRRDRIHARVEQAIEAENGSERDVEALSSAAWERLTDEDDAEILDLPMDEVVARICLDLGLSPAGFVCAFTRRESSAPEGAARAGPAPVPAEAAWDRSRAPAPPPTPPPNPHRPDPLALAGMGPA